MRRTLFISLVVFAATLFSNGVAAQNIVHGVKVVVIDAGHGGKFPGAHYAGVYEKNLTLSVALELGRLVEEGMPGVKVVYTRKTDKELGETLAADLQKRADIANKAGGDLFVSIHVNAARSTSACGVETLIMGETPKEQRYNENALFENNREDLIDMSDEKTAAIVRAYIQNLQFTYGEYSMAMARCIRRQYVKAERRDRGIKPQLLRVLYATDMPGVLTEIGFMSNAAEMAYMKSEKGQREIALSLFEAVKNYDEYVKGTQMADLSDSETVVPADALPAPADATSEPAKEVSSAKPAQPAAKPEQPAPAAKPSQSTPNPEPATKTPAVKPVVKSGYTVQVMALDKVLSDDTDSFKSYKGKLKRYVGNGPLCHKYCFGFWESRNEAQRHVAEVRRVFPGAYVVQCEDGKIVK